MADYLIDGRLLSSYSREEIDALLIEIARERDAMSVLLRAASHGMARLRAHVDPEVSREEAREMKKRGGEPL